MQFKKLARVAMAGCAALAIAGPASAFTVEFHGEDGSKSLLMSVDDGTNYLRGLVSGFSFTHTTTTMGDAWLVTADGTSTAYTDTLASFSEQATYGPTYDALIKPDSGDGHVAAIPEPSAALLLALGMTVSGAHLRRQRRA